MRRAWVPLLTVALVGVLAGSAAASAVIVNHDEWTLSNFGFTSAGGSNAANFTLNVADAMTGGGTGSFAVYSTNFGLTETSFLNTLTGAGHTVTTAPPAFSLANLQGFDGVFLGGAEPAGYDASVLVQYVLGGGSVYIAAGTGVGGAAAEAARWNSFLDDFDLALDDDYNGVQGNIATPAHALFAGVSQLYFNNGNTVVSIGPDGQIIMTTLTSGLGVIGLAEVLQEEPPRPRVPLPGALALVLLGGAMLAGAARLRR
jgi:hypothetical protein